MFAIHMLCQHIDRQNPVDDSKGNHFRHLLVLTFLNSYVFKIAHNLIYLLMQHEPSLTILHGFPILDHTVAVIALQLIAPPIFIFME